MDWVGESVDGCFLCCVWDGVCVSFNVVLGFDYNVVYWDYFYFDMGLWKVCW